MNKKNTIAKFTTSALLGTALLCGGVIMTQQAQASTWHANSPESINIVQGQKVYTVKEGDTLWAISIKTNIKVATLAQASGISNPNFIQVGQKIILDGNKLTVKNNSGQVVSQQTLKPTDKVVANQGFGTPVTNAQAVATQVAATNSGSIQNTTPVQSSTASTPVNNVQTPVVNNSSVTTTPAGNNPVTTPQNSATTTTPASSTNTGDTTLAQSNQPVNSGSTTNPSSTATGGNGQSLVQSGQSSTDQPAQSGAATPASSATSSNTQPAQPGSSSQTVNPASQPAQSNTSAPASSATSDNTQPAQSGSSSQTVNPSNPASSSSQPVQSSAATPASSATSSNTQPAQSGSSSQTVNPGSSSQTVNPATPSSSASQPNQSAAGNQSSAASSAAGVDYLTDPSNPQSFFNEKGIQETEQDFVALLNKQRAAKGIAPLTVEPELQQTANLRANQDSEHFAKYGTYDFHKLDNGQSIYSEFPNVKWSPSDNGEQGEVEADSLIASPEILKEYASVSGFAKNDPMSVAQDELDSLNSDQPHYDIIMNPDYKYIGVGMVPVETPDGGYNYPITADFMG